MSEHLLEVKNLRTNFATGGGIVQAVRGVSLYVDAGEFIGIIGESGCGKSVSMMSVMQLLADNAAVRADAILFDGMDLQKQSRKQMRKLLGSSIGMIFQDPMTSLDPRQTVNEIIGGPLRLQKMVGSKKEQDERVLELLHMVGLKDDHANRYPHEFSGGQRQRIGIARALGLEPRFIVCDEPISALDVSIQAQVVNLLEDFQERLGLTYLFISHDLSMIRHISHQVGVMYLGHLVEVAEVEELYTNMRHPYTQSLMSAAPIADPRAAAVSQRIILEGDVPSPLNPPSGCPFRTRCRFATEQCAAEMPALQDIGGGHLVACHHML